MASQSAAFLLHDFSCDCPMSKAFDCGGVGEALFDQWLIRLVLSR
jgi:hypothetical protein